MIIISSAELRNNMRKYLDLAKANNTVIVQRGRKETYILTCQDDLPEDFHKAITMDEAISRVEHGMRKIIEKNGNAKTV